MLFAKAKSDKTRPFPTSPKAFMGRGSNSRPKGGNSQPEGCNPQPKGRNSHPIGCNSPKSTLQPHKKFPKPKRLAFTHSGIQKLTNPTRG